MHKLLLFLSLLFMTACDQINGRVCTDIGCYNNFELAINAEDDSLSVGDYAVHLSLADTLQLSCSFTLKKTGSSCRLEDCIENRVCDQYENADIFFTSAFYEYQQGKILVQFPPLDGELDITIIQDSTQLLNLVTEPVYITNRPNGPGCEPTCFNATNEVTVIRE